MFINSRSKKASPLIDKRVRSRRTYFLSFEVYTYVHSPSEHVAPSERPELAIYKIYPLVIPWQRKF